MTQLFWKCQPIEKKQLFKLMVKDLLVKLSKKMFFFSIQDIVDQKLLWQISEDEEVSSNWKQLAKHVGLKKSRINAVAELYQADGCQKCCYESLLTWFKQSPKSEDKVGVLIRALTVIGQRDMSETIEDLYRDFRRGKSSKILNDKMNIAVLKICQEPQIQRRWLQLPKVLQISEASSESIKRLNLSTL